MGIPIPRQTLWEFDSLDKRLGALEGQLAKLCKHGGDFAEKAASEVKVKAAQQLHDSAAAFLKAAGLDADSPTLGAKATNSDVEVVTTQLSASFDAYRDRHVEKRYGRMFWLVQEQGGEVEYVPVSERAEAPADD
jgi:hypothetical protein